MTEQDKSLTSYLQGHRHRRNRELTYDFMPSVLEIVEKPAHVASKVIIGTMALLLVGIIVWASVSSIDRVVVGSGQLMPEAKLQPVSVTTAGKVKTIKVSEGAYVKKDDVLLELDDASLEKSETYQKQVLKQLEAEQEVLTVYQGNHQASVDVGKYPESIRPALQRHISENTFYREQLGSTPSATLAQYQALLGQRVAEVKEKIGQVKNELAQLELSKSHLKVLAPSDGHVSSISVTYPGQVVGSEKPLLTIVPVDSPLVFEAYVSDKDMAKLKIKMTAVIKLQAYSFSDYGTVTGKVVQIGETAISLEGVGNVYAVKIEVEQKKLNPAIKLKSGLSGTVEFHIGKRTVLDYFLEPITEGLDNSLKEN